MTLAALAILPLTERSASACGGCFRPSQTVTAVNAHRMVFSISQQRTILWDQFSYTGNPQDFAWVLPVHAAGVQLQLAHDEFIAALDAWSAPVIVAPAQSSGSSFGCGSAANSATYGGDKGVQVINQEIVGPYEVATLRSTDANALENWLASHGYEIPPSVQPTIAAYVSGGFDFLALRLQPGQGVAAMQPVRVVSAGADPTLPLRMVAAGIGADVSIVLYVISEGRYEASNFNNTEVDFTKLEWNKTSNSSNYDTLIKNAMTSGDGRNFTVEFAGHMFASDSFPSGFRQSFQNVYYQGAISSAKCPYTQIHGNDFSTDAGSPTFADAADDAAAGDASVDDGGVEAGSGDGGGLPLGAPYDACNFDDLTSATQDMALNDVFVTRLRADLKVSALSQDLVLHAAQSQAAYDNVHNALQTGDGCATSGETPDRSVILIALGALAAIFAARRKR